MQQFFTRSFLHGVFLTVVFVTINAPIFKGESQSGLLAAADEQPPVSAWEQ